MVGHERAGITFGTYNPEGMSLRALREVVETSVLRPGDRIFNPELWGSWLEFRFPRTPVFDDSRIEVFSARVWNQYDQVSVLRNTTFDAVKAPQPFPNVRILQNLNYAQDTDPFHTLDLYLPKETGMRVKTGDKVTGGESIIGVLP